MRAQVLWLVISSASCVSQPRFDDIQRERSRLEAELAHSREEVARLAVQTQDLVVRLDDAVRAADQVRRDWDDLKDKDAGAALVARLRSELEAKTLAAEALASSVDLKTGSIKDLSDKLMAATKQAAALREENATLAAEVKRLTPTRPVVPVVGKVYGGAGGGHWVRDKVDSGRLVILEDGSLWDINAVDRIDTMLWLPTEEVFVMEEPGMVGAYRLINTDSEDDVMAIYLGNR